MHRPQKRGCLEQIWGLQSVLVIPGRRASTRPQMRNCALGNLKIPGSMLRIDPE
jgi:hypothetical protein